MKAFLVYSQYLTADGASRTLGGIQTYMTYLTRLFATVGIEPVIVQAADASFEVRDGGTTVIGCRIPQKRGRSRLADTLWQTVAARADFSRDLVIFCTESVSVRTNYERAILIQHGVSWDIPLDLLPATDLLRKLAVSNSYIGYLRKAYQARHYAKLFANTRNRVCVDYNFPNWLRTQQIRSDHAGIEIIPNCVFQTADGPPAGSPTRAEHHEGAISVLFSRRMEQYRGSRLMADAVELACAAGSNTRFTFAGEGSDLEYISARFAGNSRVAFARYDAEDSLAFHAGFDIAVVPSLASEGTSLSVLEAMAAGCAVIATPVGGVSNIIIDGFNGVFSAATPAALASHIVALADDPLRRRELAARASTVIADGSFSYDAWRTRWLDLVARLR